MIAESLCQDGAISAVRFSSVWSIEEWWQVREVLTDIFRTAVGQRLSKEQVLISIFSL